MMTTLLLVQLALALTVATAMTVTTRVVPQQYSVALVALGCPKNTVDAEVMLGDLQRNGLRVVQEPGDADVVIVNTCAFVEDAKSESIAAVIEAAQLKCALHASSNPTPHALSRCRRSGHCVSIIGVWRKQF